MKIIYPLLLLSVLLSACGKENKNAVSTVPVMDMPGDSVVILKTGQFTNGPYGNVTGTATVLRELNGDYRLLLQNFNTTNGPDLYVYLSKGIMPANFISLGMLRSTNGDQLYDIPGIPPLTEYKYINIHCQRFNHLFGYALLQ